MHMSNKIRTTLTLDKTIVKRAKELDINISAAAERGIINYIKEIEMIGESIGRKLNKCNNKSYKHYEAQNSGNIGKDNNSMDWVGFEPTASTLRR
ncbi:MAG: type II toxin-antitoxin system CcdA family antitoxin [Thermoplasmatales archaeon]|nr:MAG: type II toxin-antitoxin system CcdA family antitoxin [Thermoplasmatales archaeon]